MEIAAMENITFQDWEPSDDIETKEDVIGIFQAALEEKDPDFLLSVLGDIARSKGMAQLARELNLDRKGLYKALAPDGNPSFKTVFNLLDLLGFQIKLVPKSA